MPRNPVPCAVCLQKSKEEKHARGSYGENHPFVLRLPGNDADVLKLPTNPLLVNVGLAKKFQLADKHDFIWDGIARYVEWEEYQFCSLECLTKFMERFLRFIQEEIAKLRR